MLSSSFLGGWTGAIFDQITVSISPHYFSLLKEIDASSDLDLRWKVGQYGFAAGALPGLIAAFLISLAALDSRHGRWRTRPLALFRYLPLYAASFLILTLPVAGAILWFDPANYRSQWVNVLSGGEIERLLLVWSLHLSIYGAGVLGTTWSMFLLIRKKPKHDQPISDSPAA
jgi:hypothetical protein